jgi:hypothetical protein
VWIGPFALNKLKQLIPVFKEKAGHLSEYFDRAIEADDGIVERKVPIPKFSGVC